MKFAVCDDERTAQETLASLLEAYAIERKTEIDYALFSSYAQLLPRLDEFDVFFVDYQMLGMDGLEFARLLRGQDGNKTIIFVTAFDEIVYDTFAVRTHRFLTKPVHKDKLFEALDAYFRTDRMSGRLTVRDSGYTSVVDLSQVLYITVQGRDSIICTETEQTLVRRTIASLEAELTAFGFFRIHRSYLVNMHQVRQFDSRSIEFANGEKIPVSTRQYAPFCKAYLKLK